MTAVFSSARALLAALCLLSAHAFAQDAPVTTTSGGDDALALQLSPPAPVIRDAFNFKDLGQTGDILLTGDNAKAQMEFGVRKDRITTHAALQLTFTPSPALLPGLSQLRVYLNDVLMNVLVINKDDLGTQVQRTLALTPALIGDFNRLRIELVGHYNELCENPAHTSIWVNLSSASLFTLDEQFLALDNDLAWFPAPFFDAASRTPTRVPMVFEPQPDLTTQTAAGILASYFGGLSQWRGAQFPVTYGALPSRKADDAPRYLVMWATNAQRYSFLTDLERFPLVNAPTVTLIQSPDDAYSKVLLILGRDGTDLRVAAQALASGGKLFRGTQVTVKQFDPLTPRVPYDAPNWIPTDRAVQFGELIDYPEQLQALGQQPGPIKLAFNLPPDLFVWRNTAVPMRLQYRYTRPGDHGDSNLNINLNGLYLDSLPLRTRSRSNEDSKNFLLSMLPADLRTNVDKVLVPALKVGALNELRFDFSYTGLINSSRIGYCETHLPVDQRALIDAESTLDMSGFPHFLQMPDLAAFIHSGFPYTRMADSSETLVIVPSTLSARGLSTLLQTLGGIGAASGYPSHRLRLTDDWAQAKTARADLLVMGEMPAELRSDANAHLVLAHAHDWLRQATRSFKPNQPRTRYLPESTDPDLRTDVAARAPMAAIVGMASPFDNQRSVIMMLASTDADYQLLRDALRDIGKRAAMAGSVVLIRSSGVDSQRVGEPYYVGKLPWWLWLYFNLAQHPILLALLSTLCVLLVAFLLWRGLRWVARRRLAEPN